MTKKRPAFKRDAFSQVLDEAAQDLAGGMKFFFLGAGEGEADDFLDPAAPMTAGTPQKTPYSPYSPSSRVETGMMRFSSCRMHLMMPAAVAAMP